MVVAVALSAVGMAAAQGPDNDPPGPGGRRGPQRDPILPKVWEAVSAATGLDREDVLPLLQEGQTFNQVLEANGIDPQVVIDAVTATVTAELDEALANGKITEERKANVLENLPEALDRLMNATLPDRPMMDRLRARFENSLVSIMAEMAGVEARDMLKDALTPPTLAEIATELGLDPDAVLATAEQRITEDINAAVADGSLTQEAADEILAGLHDRLVERFNSPLGPLGGQGGRMNRPGMGTRGPQQGGRVF
jgi:arsenate reductase-like glutaredoxin family protein